MASRGHAAHAISMGIKEGPITPCVLEWNVEGARMARQTPSKRGVSLQYLQEQGWGLQ